MVLDHDPILLAQDDLAETLAAAQRALEHLTASSLPFSAQVRVSRESSRRARAWVLENVDLSPFPVVPVEPAASEPARAQAPAAAAPLVDLDDADPHTEEVERETGETGEALHEEADPDALELVSFDDGDEQDDRSDLADLEELSDEPLVSFDDGGAGDDALDHAEPTSDEDLESLIAYDEGFDVDVDGSLGLADDESSSDDPSPADLSSLVVFDDEQPVVTLGGDDRSRKATPAPEPRIMRERVDDEDSLHDGTLVTDLDELVKLEDLLQEENAAEAARRATTPKGTETRVVGAQDQKVRVATTLTDEDLGLLGFNSQRELVSPEGSDADPASETGSRKAIPVARPPRRDDDRPIEPLSGYGAPAARPPAAVPVSSTASPGPARALGALPTIRDQAERPAASTARAAIRLEPGGKGTVVQPSDDLLALDGADDDDGGEGGFSIEVEEYEFVEEEEEVQPDSGPAGKPGGSAHVAVAAAPIAAPKLTNDQRQLLARTAKSAADRGDFSTAANLFADILDYDPDYVPALVGRGRAYLDLGDYARAMSDFTVAADLAPEDPDTNAAIGKLYYDRKDYGRAIDYFDRTLKRDGKHAMAWCWRGIAQYYRKDYAAAYDDLVHAQKLDGNIPNIGTYIAMVKKKRK